ncbi:TRAP-type mannitol/chloroaromatic compound transport system, substrate-binding protein [Celeribacter baekdonensis]|uniref:TRAP-type mannitol/chloroaromatic compound transport system, substrate-binding protein n=1 Tax=Celeribacter baekdonensis TaxID=875171 RepID=A0A1G7U294_9RHOB|nr:TRAP transporter substrate-binding protein [Celeribacter baekdonensis]SDG40910.1 TRAP-type mannitol/chloroaromatic compound transport system, substrate-binding protein [Celeribacter baekdonensis]
MKTHIKSLVTLAVTVSTLVAAPAMAKGTRLDIQSAWPLTMPASGANAAYLGETLNESSGGSLDVTIYGAGKLVPSLQIFDAVQQGTLDAGITSPLYVAGRFPAVQLFGGIPFGPDAITHTAWLYDGGGREIWSEIYAKQGVVTIPCGLMDSEAGGWYNFEINTVDDFKGKKLRFAGLAGEVMAKVGASIVLLPGGEIYPGLEKGLIDGTELSMPAIDITLGLQQVGKYYYLPGWHQPAAMNELIVNQAKWDSLDASQQVLIEESCKAVNLESITSTMALNAKAVAEFEAAGVEIKSFPSEVLDPLQAAFDEVIAEQVAKDADFKRVWESLTAYRASVAPWAERR